MSILLAACTPQAEPPSAAPAAATPAVTTITITAQVPDGAPVVYLTGNLPALGPWSPDALAMSGEGRLRTATLDAPIGHRLEYKVTAGSWAREGVGPSGTVLPNAVLDVTEGAAGAISIVDFKKDPRAYLKDWQGSGVRGRLETWFDVSGQGLEESRHVVIWLPPGYDDDPARRYPVLYMHDGQNLFDPRLANTGTDWGVDEAMTDLVAAGTIPAPAIVVGVFSTADRRLEYAPQKVMDALPEDVRAEVKAEFGGDILGDAYIRFLAEELKPRIDAAYRTKAGPEDTAIAGSSMGGLISLYALLERPDVFGGAAALSIHWPVAITRERIFDGAEDWRPMLVEAYHGYLEEAPDLATTRKLWVDHGTLELDSLYAPYQEALLPVLREAGFVYDDTLVARVYPGTTHNEAAWRARLAEPLTYLFRE